MNNDEFSIKSLIDPIYVIPTPLNINELVKLAIEQPTLIDALTFISVWESERIVKQARFNFGSGSNGAGWDTCFRTCISTVMKAWEEKQKQVSKKLPYANSLF